jgi:hypothetical protein
LTGPTALEQVGLSNALTLGRGGLGVVMVRAAGNDRRNAANANDDGYCSDPRIVTVAAVRQDGRVASYSEPGACVLVAAPSGDAGWPGMFTTDLKGSGGVNQISYFPPNEDLSDYMFRADGFSGTSAATPQISGVVALLLSANPTLSRRDVQQILLLSSRHFDFADPDLATNGAGFRVSHNLGFGVPDAGEAVRLAKSWSNRPSLNTITLTNRSAAAIPDDALRVEVMQPGSTIPLLSIAGLPGTGPHPDQPTPALQLVDVGLAEGPIPVDLTGRGALIVRGGGATFAQKIGNAAAAGAGFAVIYNYPSNATAPTNTAPGGEQLIPLGGTDFVPIPAIFIGNSGGETLKAWFGTNDTVGARLILHAANLTFAVTNTLHCEHIGLRLKTDHSLRGDLRITLASPMGTRSVLQRYNSDETAGPEDWTYWSIRHFGESSVGTWTLSVGDEGGPGFSGSILEASLILTGVAIPDVDHDGLDDDWERRFLGNLAGGPQDDPDRDGLANAREQAAGTNPATVDRLFELDFSWWNEDIARVSWPGLPGDSYEVFGGDDPAALWPMATVPPTLPETEWFVPAAGLPQQFFQIRVIAEP